MTYRHLHFTPHPELVSDRTEGDESK